MEAASSSRRPAAAGARARATPRLPEILLAALIVVAGGPVARVSAYPGEAPAA